MKKILVSFALLLAAISVFLFYSNQPAKKELESAQQDLELQKKSFTELDDLYQEVINQLEQQRSIGAELRFQADGNERQLSDLRSREFEIKKDFEELRELYKNKKFKEAQTKKQKLIEKYKRDGWMK